MTLEDIKLGAIFTFAFVLWFIVFMERNDLWRN